MYANSLHGEFVFDDLHAITGNADVDATKTPLSSLFRNNFWGQYMSTNTAEHQVVQYSHACSVCSALFRTNLYFYFYNK